MAKKLTKEQKDEIGPVKLGRPTKYSEAVNQRVLELMQKGYSLVEVACELGVARDTLYEWQNKHPRFSYTIKRGRELEESWWRKVGRGITLGKIEKGNATTWVFTMKTQMGWKEENQGSFTEQQVANLMKSAFNVNKSIEQESADD